MVAHRMSSPFDGFRKLGRRAGESTPPIITQDTPATFGPYGVNSTPEEAYTPGTYLTTIGTIDTVEAVWTINGSPADGTDVLAEDDVVGLSELVTNTNADERPFGYGVAPAVVVPPTIVSTSPADDATGVADTVSPTITFSENVVFGTGLIALRENDGGWADLETFDVVTDVGTGNGQVSISGAVLTINPTTTLTAGREYAIRIASTAIDDLDGNSFAGVTDDSTISFSVLGDGPVIDTLAYDSGTNTISFNTDTVSGTAYYDLAANSTPLSGAAIEASAMGSIAVSAGVVTEVEDLSSEPPGTYWLNVVHKDGGAYSNVLTLEIEIGAFNPATLAAFLWDASDTSKLWQNTAGSTAVTTTGDPVARIDNAGTLGGTLVNTGATDRPVYTTSGALRYLQFDGSNDFLQWLGSDGDIDITGGFYMIAGMHEEIVNNAKGFISLARTSGAGLNDTSGICWSSANTGSAAIEVFGGPANTNGVGIGDYDTTSMPLAIVEFEVIPSTGATNAWLRVRRVADGDVVEKGTDTATSGQFPNNATLTAQIVLGSRITSGNPANFGQFRMYCGAMVLGTVTSQNKADYRAWVAGKIGF